MQDIETRGELKLGELYSEDFLKDIKDELESKYGTRLAKITNQKQLILVCKSAYNSNCQFNYYFIVEKRPKSIIYRFQSFSNVHSPDCVDPEEAQFLINRKQLHDQSGAIQKIIHEKLRRGLKLGNPRSILGLLCSEVGIDPDFMCRNLKDNGSKRKMKKKFDNIIAEAKRNLPRDVLKYPPTVLNELLKGDPDRSSHKCPSSPMAPDSFEQLKGNGFSQIYTLEQYREEENMPSLANMNSRKEEAPKKSE